MEYDNIIAEWYEETVHIPLAPEPVIAQQTIVYERPMQNFYHIPFMKGIVRRIAHTCPPMQYQVADSRRKGLEAIVFDRVDSLLDTLGHDLDSPIVKNDKPVYRFGGHAHDKRVKCNFLKIDKYYASLETE